MESPRRPNHADPRSWATLDVVDAPPRAIPPHDLGVRLIGIPLLGIVIPQVTGVYGDIPPTSPFYWAGFFYFILLSFILWQGNRYLLIKQRERFDWLDHPLRKAALLVVANAFYTVPVTVLMLLAWYRAAGFPSADWGVIRSVSIIVLTCVVFVTHAYETVHLIHQRSQDALRVEQLERARVESELEALRNQLDPHFVFNSLNALAHLVETDSARALTFTECLADVYHYVLLNRNRELVLLRHELDFLDNYHKLVCLRYGNALILRVAGDQSQVDTRRLPPISLQVLLENAVKHNVVTAASPLGVEVLIGDGFVSMENPRRPGSAARMGSGLGLQNLDARCRLILGRGIEVVATSERFAVRLPTM
jgi:hypothetical protein